MLTTDVRAALAALRAGGLVAVPTETVYGLGADADDAAAVGRIFAVKGRPSSHPVIVHVAGATALDDWARRVPRYARDLAEACWPGPLTLVLPRSPRAGNHVTGGADTVGLRAPAHPLTHDLLTRLDGGLAAPSANRFGRVSPTTADHVVAELGELLEAGRDLVLDGGPCAVGVESTIIDATGPSPRLLRPGAVSVSDVQSLTGLDVDLDRGTVPAPGTLASHYSPRARVVLCQATTVTTSLSALAESGGSIGLLAPASVPSPDLAEATLRRLAAPTDAAAYARVLYSCLRDADELQLDVVVAVLPEGEGLAAAVRDRLRRAAAGSHPEAT